MYLNRKYEVNTNFEIMKNNATNNLKIYGENSKKKKEKQDGLLKKEKIEL